MFNPSYINDPIAKLPENLLFLIKLLNGRMDNQVAAMRDMHDDLRQITQHVADLETRICDIETTHAPALCPHCDTELAPEDEEIDINYMILRVANLLDQRGVHILGFDWQYPILYVRVASDDMPLDDGLINAATATARGVQGIPDDFRIEVTSDQPRIIDLQKFRDAFKVPRA